MGLSGILATARLVGGIGLVYWLAVASILLCAVIVHPPMRPVLNSEGLPVVRSLSIAEREMWSAPSEV